MEPPFPRGFTSARSEAGLLASGIDVTPSRSASRSVAGGRTAGDTPPPGHSGGTAPVWHRTSLDHRPYVLSKPHPTRGEGRAAGAGERTPSRALSGSADRSSMVFFWSFSKNLGHRLAHPRDLPVSILNAQTRGRDTVAERSCRSSRPCSPKTSPGPRSAMARLPARPWPCPPRSRRSRSRTALLDDRLPVRELDEHS